MPILKESFSESLIEIAPVYAEYHPVDDLLEVEEIGSDPGSGFVELRLRVNLDIEILEADVSAQADAAVEDKQEKLRRVELPAVARETLNATLAKVLDRLEVSNKLRQMPVERRLQLRRAELNRLDQERLAMTRRLDEFGVKQPLNLEATERLQYETARLLGQQVVEIEAKRARIGAIKARLGSVAEKTSSMAGEDTVIRQIDAIKARIGSVAEKTSSMAGEDTVIRQIDAIKARIGSVAEKASSKADEDAIVRQLVNLVEARRKLLEGLRQGQGEGRATAAEVSQSEAALAEAEIRLLERKEAVVQAAGGEALLRLNAELLTLEVDLHELTERQAVLQDQHEQLAKMRSKAAVMTGLQEKLNRLNTVIASAEDAAREAEREWASMPQWEMLQTGEVRAR